MYMNRNTILRSLVLLLVLIFSLEMIHAQIPQGFNYQGILRNDQGQIKSNSKEKLSIKLLSGSDKSEIICERLVQKCCFNKIGKM